MKTARIGFAGAHRTGKTTLAQKVGIELGLHYLDASVIRSIVWSSGYSPSDIVPFVERIFIQDQILKEHYRLLKATEGSFVIDRTPLDILAYLSISIDGTASALSDLKVKELRSMALAILKKQFTHVVLVQPGIEYDRIPGKDGKAFSSKAFQNIMTDLIFGSLRGLENDINTIIVPTNMLDIKDRVNYVLSEIG
jgi:predicted ATPase